VDSLEASKSTSTPLSTERHGRPAKSSSSVHNQQVFHNWFRQAVPDGEGGEGLSGNPTPGVFSLMC
jgi:hypothetical protein